MSLSIAKTLALFGLEMHVFLIGLTCHGCQGLVADASYEVPSHDVLQVSKLRRRMYAMLVPLWLLRPGHPVTQVAPISEGGFN